MSDQWVPKKEYDDALRQIHRRLESLAAAGNYEQGTWTPAYTSTGATWTYTYQEGFYIKIGKLVVLTFYICTTALSGTTTNTVTITGLPFPSQSTFAGVAIGLQIGLAYEPVGAVYGSAIYLRRGLADTQFIASNIPNGTAYLTGTAVYKVA